MDMTGFKELTKYKVKIVNYVSFYAKGNGNRKNSSPMMRISSKLSQYLITKRMVKDCAIECISFNMYYNGKELFFKSDENGEFVFKMIPLIIHSAIFQDIIDDYPILKDRTTHIPIDIINDEKDVGLLLKLNKVKTN